jgi:hypothetical protein
MAFGNEKIEVVVEKDGTSTVDGKNFEDAGCHKAMAEVEKALGKVTKQTMKPEGLREVVIGNKVKVGQ